MMIEDIKEKVMISIIMFLIIFMIISFISLININIQEHSIPEKDFIYNEIDRNRIPPLKNEGILLNKGAIT